MWLVIFGYFAVPAEYQRRVLLYGVLGAIVMRTVMVFAGAWLISEFHWVLYLFGLLLLSNHAKLIVNFVPNASKMELTSLSSSSFCKLQKLRQ